MSLKNFKRRLQTLRNIHRQYGFNMQKIEGKCHEWYVADEKGRHHAMAWKISYESSGYFVVRFAENKPGHFGPARFSLRSDSNISEYGTMIMLISRLRAKRRQ